MPNSKYVFRIFIETCLNENGIDILVICLDINLLLVIFRTPALISVAVRILLIRWYFEDEFQYRFYSDVKQE